MPSTHEKPTLACNWSKLTVPATPGALPLIQSLLLAQASVNGFGQATQMRMQAARAGQQTTAMAAPTQQFMVSRQPTPQQFYVAGSPKPY